MYQSICVFFHVSAHHHSILKILYMNPAHHTRAPPTHATTPSLQSHGRPHLVSCSCLTLMEQLIRPSLLWTFRTLSKSWFLATSSDAI